MNKTWLSGDNLKSYRVGLWFLSNALPRTVIYF